MQTIEKIGEADRSQRRRRLRPRLPEVKRALAAIAGGLYRLPRALPQRIALEMIATGEPISAERAHALGMVNHLAPADGLIEAALKLAGRITVNPPVAVRESLAVARRAGPACRRRRGGRMQLRGANDPAREHHLAG